MAKEAFARLEVGDDLGQALRVHFDAAQLAAVQRLLTEFPAKAPRVIAQALNEAMRHARAVAIRAVSQNLGIAQKDIRGGHSGFYAIQVNRATPQRLSTELATSHKRIPVILLGAKPDQPYGPRPRSGVSWRQGKGRSRRRARSAFVFPGGIGGEPVHPAFSSGPIGRFRRRRFYQRWGDRGRTSGHFGVAIRVGAKKRSKRGRKEQKIKAIRGSSIWHAATHDPELANALNTDIRAKLMARLQSKLDWLLDQQAQRAQGRAQFAEVMEQGLQQATGE